MSIVAETILQQLGGNKFRAMTGVKDMVVGEKRLTMRLPRQLTANRLSGVIITLNNNDFYDMTAFKIKKLESVTIEEIKDVPAENLQKTFTKLTGLFVSL